MKRTADGYLGAISYFEAEKEYQLAIELDPNSARAYEGYASLMAVLRRHDESIVLARRPQQVDPRAADPRDTMGRMFLYACRYEEAEQQFMAALDIAPSSQSGHARLADIYGLTGQYEKTASARQRALVLGGATEEEAAGLPDTTILGAEGYWRWMLDYWTKRAKQEYVPRTSIAAIYAYLGDEDQAMRWLEEGYEEREVNLTFLNVGSLTTVYMVSRSTLSLGSLPDNTVQLIPSKALHHPLVRVLLAIFRRLIRFPHNTQRHAAVARCPRHRAVVLGSRFAGI